MFHVEGCRAAAQLCQLWWRQRDTTWASFKSRLDKSQLRSPLERQESRPCGGSELQSSVAHAAPSWHPRLTRSPSFHAAPTPAAAPSDWDSPTSVPPRVETRGRTPGTNKDRRGLGVDRQNKPRLFFCRFPPVCPCRALATQPDCWFRQVKMPKAAGWSYYRGSNTTWGGSSCSSTLSRPMRRLWHITSYV